MTSCVVFNLGQCPNRERRSCHHHPRPLQPPPRASPSPAVSNPSPTSLTLPTASPGYPAAHRLVLWSPRPRHWPSTVAPRWPICATVEVTSPVSPSSPDAQIRYTCRGRTARCRITGKSSGAAAQWPWPPLLCSLFGPVGFGPIE
jgi:hypothetical protein